MQSVTATWERSGGQEFKNSLSAAAELQHSLQSNTTALTHVLERQSQLMETYSKSDLQGVLQALADAVARLGGDRPRPNYPPPPPELSGPCERILFKSDPITMEASAMRNLGAAAAAPL